MPHLQNYSSRETNYGPQIDQDQNSSNRERCQKGEISDVLIEADVSQTICLGKPPAMANKSSGPQSGFTAYAHPLFTSRLRE